MRKAQISLEFVTSMLFVILLLAFILFTASDQVPDIQQNTQRASINLEAWQLTSMLLDSSGEHSFDGGGADWERNASTVQSLEEVGLASDFHIVERDKVMALETVGTDKLNYSRFRDVTDVSNQFRLEFTAVPVVDTSNKFTRTEPPEEPNIIEPDSDEYNTAGNDIGYGSIVMGGTQYNVLTTSHDGEYDTVYMINSSERDWNFLGIEGNKTGDGIRLGDREFDIEGFHNTRDSAGNVVVLSRELNTFGSQFDVDSTVVKLNRYASLKQEGADLHPLRIEVYSWN